MSHENSAGCALAAFGLFIIVNGGLDAPVTGSSLIGAVSTSYLLYIGMRLWARLPQ